MSWARGGASNGLGAAPPTSGRGGVPWLPGSSNHKYSSPLTCTLQVMQVVPPERVTVTPGDPLLLPRPRQQPTLTSPKMM